MFDRIRSMSVASMCSLMAIMVSIGASQAFAQNDALRPPKADNTEGSPKYVIYIIAVLLTGAVVFAATLKSKRSHQD